MSPTLLFARKYFSAFGTSFDMQLEQIFDRSSTDHLLEDDHKGMSSYRVLICVNLCNVTTSA